MLGEVNYRADVVRDDPDGQVADTLRVMGRYAMEDAATPQIQNDAQRCMAGAADEVDAVRNVWGMTQGKIQFLRDEVTGAPLASGVLAGKGDVVEVLVRPRDMAALPVGSRIGDCDDYSMYAASVLVAMGVPCGFVTVAGDDTHPGMFTHVYVVAYPKGGDGQRVRVALDASHGKEFGWEALQMKPWARWREWPVEEGMSSCYQVGGAFADVVRTALVFGGLWVMWKLAMGQRVMGVTL